MAAALVIDMLTYVLHYAIDNHEFKGVSVMERVAFEFQIHHIRPGDVVKRGWLRNNTIELCLYGAAPLALLSLLFEPGRFGNLFFLYCGVWGGSVATTHALAHTPRHKSRIVRGLQKAGLILPPHRHRDHHYGGEAEFKSYSLLNGWTNRILDLVFSGAPQHKRGSVQ